MILILRLWNLLCCSELFIISIECQIPQYSRGFLLVGRCRWYLFFLLSLENNEIFKNFAQKILIWVINQSEDTKSSEVERKKSRNVEPDSSQCEIRQEDILWDFPLLSSLISLINYTPSKLKLPTLNILIKIIKIFCTNWDIFPFLGKGDP